ncbi:DUF1653 domain-containing protein [Patescibacteria group bacterium]|nr:DUF1653 domain-containing protein [Patescibacteria group bacterium]
MEDLSEASHIQQGIYQHYKGGIYKVIGMVCHSETLEELVYYQEIKSKTYWVRPLSMFLENVEVAGKIVPRFKLIEPISENT